MLSSYRSTTGRLEPVWTVEIQTVADDVDRILDAIVEVYPLRYGRYERNASVTASGVETARPMAGSTTDTHEGDFTYGDVETFPMVEVKISVPRDPTVLEKVMTAVLDIHHYEEPVIFVREAWASRANYDPESANPNRWWNNGRGLPDRVADIATALRRPPSPGG